MSVDHERDIIIIIIIMNSWICHWGITPRVYNLGLARQFVHKQIKIQVQGLFSVQCLLK